MPNNQQPESSKPQDPALRIRLGLKLPLMILLAALAFLAGLLLSPFVGIALENVIASLKGEPTSSLSANERKILINVVRSDTVARILNEIGATSDAAALCQTALTAAKKRKIPELQLCYLANTLKSKSATGSLTSIENLYKQFETLLAEHPQLSGKESSDNLLLIAYINLIAADTAIKHNNFPVCEERLNRASHYAKKITGSQWLKAYISDKKGSQYYRQRRYKEALAEYHITLAFLEKAGDTSYGGHKKVDLLYNMCSLAMELNLLDEQIDLAKKGLQLLSTSKDETRYFYKRVFSMILSKAAQMKSSQPD